MPDINLKIKGNEVDQYRKNHIKHENLKKKSTWKIQINYAK